MNSKSTCLHIVMKISTISNENSTIETSPFVFLIDLDNRSEMIPTCNRCRWFGCSIEIEIEKKKSKSKSKLECADVLIFALLVDE